LANGPKREGIYIREFLGFLNSVNEYSIVLGYDALSPGTLAPTIWKNVLCSSSRFQGHRRETEKRHDVTFPRRQATSYPDMLTVRHMSCISRRRFVEGLRVGLWVLIA